MTYATKFQTSRPIKRHNKWPLTSPSHIDAPVRRPARKVKRKLQAVARKFEKKRKKLPIQLQDKQRSKFEVKQQLYAFDKLPFQGVLSDEEIKRIALKYIDPDSRDRVFDMTTTLWVFLSQVLDPDHSCRGAVARYIAFLANEGKSPCSLNTGSYCKARKRLPEGMISELACNTARLLENEAPIQWLWKGRSITLVDGSTLSMSDTPENQKAYPQSKSQKRGVGFPIARVVALISMTTGAVFDFAIGPYAGKETGEHALLRQLMHNFSPNDIMMGDGYYGCFWLLASLIMRGIDGVFPISGSRDFDFRKGEKFGTKDHIVIWHKPQRPKWMDKETYDSYPDSIKVRELEIDETAYNSGRVLVTTLLDQKVYSRNDISKLYDSRWLVEVDLNSIKTTMQMGILRGKSPEMIQKEIWMHLLGYNLIRKVISQSASVNEQTPHQISFKGALQTINSFRQSFQFSEKDEIQYRALLNAISSQKVGSRPGRSEPRVVKRRPKPFRRLTKPRHKYKTGRPAAPMP